MSVFPNPVDTNGHKVHKGIKSADQDDLIKLALEQQAKLQKEKDDLEAAQRAQAKKDAADAAARAELGGVTDGRDGSGEGSGDGYSNGSGDGPVDGSGSGPRVMADGDESEGEKNNFLGVDDDKNKDDADEKKKKRLRAVPLVPDMVTGKLFQ